MKIVPEGETERLLPEQPKRTFLRGCMPLNLFIILTISILILAGSLLLWGSSYALTNQAITELTNKLINVSGEKIVGFLDGMLKPVGMETKSIAKEYMLSSMVFTPAQQRGFLYPKIADFGNNGVGYYFEKPYNARYTYTFPVGYEFMQFIYQEFASNISITDRINITTGALIKANAIVSTTQYINKNQAFYTFTLAKNLELGVDGVYGDPYITGGVLTVYYTHLLYEPTLYQFNRTKERIGVAKINLSLIAVANYLSQITLLGRGYVVVAHTSGTCIGASIQVNQSTPHIFDIQDRSAGELLRQFYLTNGNSSDFKNSTSTFIVGQKDNIPYIITPIKYKLENLEWNIFFVLYEEEVTATLKLTTYVSIGVTVAIVIVGLMASLVIGFIVARPMRFLEKQFRIIKVFDLDNVVSSNSVFKEVNSIFDNLDETVEWLKEIKSFIPPYVLEQIQNSESVKKEDKPTDTEIAEQNRKGSAKSFAHSNNSESFHTDNNNQSSRKNQSSYRKGPVSLFKMGLQKNPAVIITIKVEGESEHVLEEAFNELTVALGPIIKLSQGNLQIISFDRFQLSFTSNSCDAKLAEKAFETALKIHKVSQTIKQKISVRIGVCIDKCSSGNLGTNTSRHYLLVGQPVQNSEMYCELASLLNVNIITDFNSFHSCDKFITRPLDRIDKNSSSSSNTSEKVIIWQVLEKKNEESDEWLYELERSKANNKFKEYSQVFELFDEKAWESIKNVEEGKTMVEKSISILEKMTDEKISTVEKLLNHFKKALEHNYSNLKDLQADILKYSSKYKKNSLEF